MIIVATITPDSPMPACAVRVQAKLFGSQSVKKIPAFDVTAACAGFLFALSIADQFIKTGAMSRVLVVGVEMMSRIVDWSDRTTAVLFGDGAGAVVVERANESDAGRIDGVRLVSDGGLADALQIPAGGTAEPMSDHAIQHRRNKVQMHGQDVYRAAVEGLSEVGRRVVTEAGLTMQDVDWFVPHQANAKILHTVAERWEVPMDHRFVRVLGETGNMSSASIPIAFDNSLTTGRFQPGHRVLSFALGAGIAYGAALIRF